LSPAAAFNAVDEAFEKSLQELGWVKGHNIDIDYRYTRDGRIRSVHSFKKPSTGIWNCT
jgi:hypothetical protein